LTYANYFLFLYKIISTIIIINDVKNIGKVNSQDFDLVIKIDTNVIPPVKANICNKKIVVVLIVD